MKKILFIATFLMTFLTGCTSLKSDNDLKKQSAETYHTYTLKNVSDTQLIDQNIIHIFEDELRRQLTRFGYEDGNDIVINYNIKAYDPGNRALRIFIGFGAGKGTLETETTLVDKNGQNLGKVNNTVSLNMGFFGGSLDKTIRVSAKDVANRIRRANILTK